MIQDNNSISMQEPLTGELNHNSESNKSFFESRNAALIVVFIGLLSDYLLLTVIIPILPLYLKEQGISAFETGILFSSKAIVQMMTNPIWGKITDQYGPRFPLFFGLSVLCLSTVGFAFSKTFTLLLLSRAIQGVASSATMTAGMTLISLKFPQSDRGAAMGSAISGIALGVLIGPPLGGLAFVDTPLGRKLPFLIIAFVLFINALFQIMLPLKENMIVEQTISIRTLLKDSEVVTLSIALALANTAIAMLEPLISTFLHHEVGVATSLTGIVFIAATLSYGIMSPIVGIAGNHYSLSSLISFGSLLLAISLPLLALPRNIVLIVLCLCGVGTGMAFIDSGAMPLLAGICESRFKSNFGAIFALSDTMFSIGYIIGPLLGTLCYHIGGFLAAMCIMGGILLVYTPILIYRSKNATVYIEIEDTI